MRKKIVKLEGNRVDAEIDATLQLQDAKVGSDIPMPSYTDVDVNTIPTGIDVGVGSDNPMPQYAVTAIETTPVQAHVEVQVQSPEKTDVGVGNETPMPQFADAANDPVATVVLHSDHMRDLETMGTNYAANLNELQDELANLQDNRVNAEVQTDMLQGEVVLLLDHHTEMETLNSNHVFQHNVLTQELVSSELQKIKFLTQIQDLKLEHMDALIALNSQLDSVKDDHIKALLLLEDSREFFLLLQDIINSKDRELSNLDETILRLQGEMAKLLDNRVNVDVNTIPTGIDVGVGNDTPMPTYAVTAIETTPVQAHVEVQVQSPEKTDVGVGKDTPMTTYMETDVQALPSVIDAATDPIQEVVTASELDAVIQGIETLEGDAMERNAAMASQTAQIAADLANETSTDLTTFL